MKMPTMALALATTLALMSGCGGDKADSGAHSENKVDTKAEAKPGGHGEHGEKDGLKLSAEEAQRAGIQLEAVQPQARVDSITVTATIRPDQDRIARIAPRVEGRIVGVTAKLGDVVRAGQPLATLDSLVIGEASSALLQAQSLNRTAEADFKRAAALNAEEIIPQKEFLRTQAEHERAEAALRAAEDRLRLLGLDPKRLVKVESGFSITSMLSGTIVQKKATVGELASPSEALFTVADLSTVWVEANLTETQIAKVKPGMAAVVSVTAYPRERFTGRVTYIASLLDKDTRTVAARIEVSNKDGRLKPEMFATASIETGAAAAHAPAVEAISVPDGAILLMQGQPTVFVFEHGGYEQRAIEPGDKLSGRTVVKSGLAAGEQVVAAGAYALKARVLKSQIGDAH